MKIDPELIAVLPDSVVEEDEIVQLNATHTARFTQRWTEFCVICCDFEDFQRETRG